MPPAFSPPARSEIEDLLRRAKTIAVVGLSAEPSRPSHGVSQAMQRFGHRIVPVTPSADEILGERAYPTLTAAVAGLAPGERIDIVDVFRRPEHVAAIVEECIALRLPALWLQDGVVDETAAARAQAAGIFTVMDRCIYRDRARLAP